jgi:uncharacterized protein (DUF58 family)
MPQASAAGLARRFNPLRPLIERAQARTARWVRRRQGEDELPVRLARRRLYILPTRGGVAFGALVFVMLLAGLNYTNSLALFLTFLLAAFALVVMQLCHRNLLGVRVSALYVPAVFAARPATLEVSLDNDGAGARLGLEAGLEGAPSACADVSAYGHAVLSVPLAARPRGVVRIARVRIATCHPFGLFRAWTWLHAPLEYLVYPSPAGTLPMPQTNVQQPGSRTRGGAGVDEWLGLRPFRDGDSPRQVDWKAYARAAPLLVKEYQPLGSDLRWFDFAQLPLPDAEARLAQLARWIVDAEAGGERYGLSLPQVRVPHDRGPEHRHRCLAQLARFGADTAPPAN